MKVFEDYAYYYDVFYGEKDYCNEAKEVEQLLRNAKPNLVPKETSIINFGCGTGKHDYELIRRGFTVKGIDLSERMISIAQEKYGKTFPNLSFSTGDFRSYRDQEKHDVVLSMFHVVSYLTSNEDVFAAFTTAHENLKEKGVFLFDLWYGPGVMNEKPEKRIKKVEDAHNLFIRYANPVLHWNENIVDVNYDVLVLNKENDKASRIQELHQMRYFFKPEIEMLLKQAGFEMIACVDCNTLKTPDEKSWTVYFLAKKG